MRVSPVRTGYDAILPIMLDDKYATTAKADGKVIKLTKSELVVEYDNIGKVTYPIKEWTSKEESNVCYTNRLIPNVSVGESFGKDDTLLYNNNFFEPDIFNSKRVIYKSGDIVTVGLLEDPQTYEDSTAISTSLVERLGTSVTKIKSYVVEASSGIHNIVNIGDIVKPESTLFTIASDLIANTLNLDEKALSILQDIKASAPKAKLSGKVNKVVVYYNCDKDKLSDSLKAIVEKTDGYLIANMGYPGKVDSNYKIKGKALPIDHVEIKIYVEVTDNMGIGDKAIYGNQLKCTVGEVYPNNMVAIKSGENIDAIFSTKSVGARIVNSPHLIGTTISLMELIQSKAVDMYFE